MEIFDAHAHIFPVKIAEKAVKSISTFYGIPMECSRGTAQELIESGQKAGINKFLISSTATTKEQVKAINTFILSAVKEYRQFVGLITLHPDNTAKEIDEEIKFACEFGLKGIKLHPDFQRFRIDDKKMYNIYSAAAGVLPILFHAGDKRYDFSSPRYIARVATMFKDLKCAAAHFGGYSEWEETKCYSDTPNVYFDTSSSLKFLPAEKAREIIQTLGEERFMFGTDYPMWRHDAEIERFNALALSEGVRQKILCQNAKRFYGID